MANFSGGAKQYRSSSSIKRQHCGGSTIVIARGVGYSLVGKHGSAAKISQRNGVSDGSMADRYWFFGVTHLTREANITVIPFFFLWQDRVLYGASVFPFFVHQKRKKRISPLHHFNNSRPKNPQTKNSALPYYPTASTKVTCS